MCRWALGVLIYFMLKGEMPFGSWRESELDTFAKIAKGQLNLPQTFSPDAVDLITKVSFEILVISCVFPMPEDIFESPANFFVY